MPFTDNEPKIRKCTKDLNIGTTYVPDVDLVKLIYLFYLLLVPIKKNIVATSR